jgi:hypothetical protein
MQLPRASRDRLIFAPSTIRIPRLSDVAARSDPARSISHNREFTTSVSADNRPRYSIEIWSSA